MAMGGALKSTAGKILSWEKLDPFLAALRSRNRLVVFTNGCFDLLHAGHVEYLEHARSLGDALIVGVNSDDSVRSIKGAGRPIVPEGQRARVLAGLAAVDAVVLFRENDPLRLILKVRPDILVKGADWALSRIVGRQEVEAMGGRVERVPLMKGLSTTAILQRIQSGGIEP